ncbi:hypothetical protein D7Z26_21510 [Cohnella endophytica]|uniref:Carbohydrate-binding protein n=1 Tax=Cohnella endophytica TaxID=2419778 RepID=A0A494XJU1_9BACL|nr:family 43 glycosylhydrolase [Cohnella endophytica]RKP48936.1 hypothetical protein D7Z26_21510 [Cohnella endophytica]
MNSKAKLVIQWSFAVLTAFLISGFLMIQEAKAAPVFSGEILPKMSDSFMTYKDGYYYLIYSDYKKDIYINKSASLSGINAGTKVKVYTAPASGADSEDTWSPFLYFINNKWYIYYSATGVKGDAFGHRVFVLQSDTTDAQGGYTSKGQLVDPYDSGNSRCALTLAPFDYNGKTYAVLSRCNIVDPVKGALSKVSIITMSDPWTASSDESFISEPTYTWEGLVDEGPVPLIHNGDLFVLHSANATHDDYKMALVKYTGSNPLSAGAWTKTSTPVFQSYSGTDGNAMNPGVPSVVKSPDGTEDWLVYHACNGPENCNGWNEQSMRAQKFTWNANGTPNFGTPLPVGVSRLVPSGETGNDAPLLSRFNDSATGTGMNQIEYSANWSSASGCSICYNNDEHFSNVTGSTATIRFTGNQIKIYSSLDPSHGKIGFSLDGGTEKLVDLYESVRHWNVVSYLSPILDDGPHTLTIRVTGQKKIGKDANNQDIQLGTDTFVSIDKVEVTALTNVESGTTTLNDTVNGTYTSGWSYGTGCGCYLNDEHFTKNANEYVTIPFYGTKIQYYGSRDPSHGIGAFSIDGGAETNVDFYAGARQWNQLMYTSPTLPLGYHTLKVRATGTKNALSSDSFITSDDVVVTGTIVTVNDSTIGTSANQFKYTGAWSSATSSTCGCEWKDEHFGNATNATVEIQFYGTQIEYFGSRDPSHGIAAFSIDGGAETNKDFYASSRLWAQSIYTSPELPLGYHTLKIRVTGTTSGTGAGANTYITVDKVKIH